MGKILRGIVAVGLLAISLFPVLRPTPAYAQANGTTIGALTLAATIKSISVYANFTGDANGNGTTVVQYRTGGGAWITGYTLYKDTRATIYSQGSGQIANPYVNQYRGSLVGLTANTAYDVRVTFTDADGVTGTNPATGSVTTRTDVFPLGAGSTYYVSTTGNDGAAGTIGAPWLTIQKAAHTVAAGDTVYVRGGTYTEIVHLQTSGAAGNYITFLAYPGETPIIDGSNADSGTTGEFALGVVKFYNPATFAGTSYVRWSGINVRNAYHSLIVLFNQANYNVIENCELSDFGYITPDAGINLGDRSSFNVMRGNTIHTARHAYADPLHRASGINMWWGAADGSYQVAKNQGNIIYDNYFYSETEGLSDSVGGYANFQYSDGPYKDSDIYDNTTQDTRDDAFEIEGGNINVRVWGNTIISPTIWTFGGAITSIGPLYQFRNVSTETPNSGGTHKLGLTTAAELTNGPVYCFQNTFHTTINSSSGVYSGGGAYWGGFHALNNVWNITGYLYYIPVGAYTEGNTFNYNLLYTTQSTKFRWGPDQFTTLATFTATSGQEVNGVWGHAAFVNSAGGDFNLSTGSLGIDVGVAIPGFNTADSAWPSSGAAPDMGAFEYTSGAPLAPTNVAATDGSSTSNVTVTWTASANATGYRVYRASVDVSGLLGAVTTYTDTTAAAGVITPGAAAATDGTNTDNVTLTISGASVANGTSYSYTVRAVGTGGVSADSTANTGYRGVGSLTYQWWRSAADSNASYSTIVGATTATYVDQTAPAPTLAGGTATAGDGTDTTNVNLAVTGTTASGAGRYYACAVSATGASDQTTTVDRGYRAVTGLTYQWFASSTDYDTGYAQIGGATTATWAYDAAPDPTITAGATVASDNLSTSYVTLTLSGSAAVPGAGRWFLCQVSAGGSSANSTHNRGYVGVGTLTVQWQRSAADSDAAYANIAGGITNPYNDSGAPSTGAGRYYKATLTATGAAGTTTTVDRGSRLTAVTVPGTGNTMSDVFGWAMVLAAVAGIFTGAKNAPRYN